MIDEKGRLFGKVNIVDLIIVIIIIAAAAFIGMKLFGPESTTANTENVRITLFCEETPPSLQTSSRPVSRPGTARTRSLSALLLTGRSAIPRAPSPTPTATSLR